MMASEQFSLCWDNFHKNMSAGMQSLLENEDLVDVTLAVEGRYLKAHKMVLSVCSPYFRELFQINPCKHPIVFMKDVSYIALSDLLQFMYQGEVQVAQENLPTFIKTAEALQIKGLTGDSSGHDSDSAEQSEAEKVIEVPVKRSHETTDIITKPVPVSRVKKPTGPASKRPRFSMPTNEISNTNPLASSTQSSTKSEVNSVSASTENDMMQFKMEPSEGSEQVSQLEENDDVQTEKYGGESIADDGNDDAEDYNLIDTTEDEPKAGTSADGTGDGQGLFKFVIQGTGIHDLVLHQHLYRFTKAINKKKLWRCTNAEYDCPAKCYTVPGKILSKIGTHNHLPPKELLANKEKCGLVVHKKLK